jgi:type VI secretion system protein ImpH
MAGTRGRNGLPVTLTARPDSPLERLAREPFRFDFFQAVRLIALAAGRTELPDPAPEGQTLPGRLPYEDHVRFRAHIGHAFPASPVSSFAVPPPGNEPDGSIPEMIVTFFGLAGTGGILPEHYTQLLIDQRDRGLRDFLDLFNHRLIAQFYRAWEKSHFYVGYELARRGHEDRDRFTQMLYALIGMGTARLRGRQAVPDEVLLYYAGHLSHRPRSAVALQQIITDFFRVPAQIQQFRGQWLQLRDADRTRLTSESRQDGNNQLGASAIAGARVWGIENKFRVRLGVLSYESFRKFLPGGSGYVSLGQIVRFYVGAALYFDVQLALDRADVPRCQIKRNGDMQLGWNTWLFSRSVPHDVDDAVFACEGMPSQ